MPEFDWTSLLAGGGLLAAGALLRSFLPTYLAEKGKNLATKEDIRAITAIVEEFKPGTAQETLRRQNLLNSKLQAYGRAMEIIYRKYAGEDFLVDSKTVPAGAADAPTEVEINVAYGSMCLFCEEVRVLDQFQKLMSTNSSPADIGDLLSLMRQDLGYGESVVPSDRMPYIFGRSRTNPVLPAKAASSLSEAR